MYNIEHYLENYIIVNSLFFLMEKWLFEKILSTNGLSIDKEINSRALWIIDILIDFNILQKKKWSITVSENLKKTFDGNSYNKLLITLWYKDFFENIWQKNKVSHAPLSEWSFQVLQWKNISSIVSFIKWKNISTLLDLWCGNSQMIIELSLIFPKIHFIWLERNSETSKKANNYIKKNKIKNVSVICWDINEINIYLKNYDVDIVTASFVLHEFIASNSIKKIIKNISLCLKPSYVIMREFCPPSNLWILENTNINSFYKTYHAIHQISGQKTFQISEWNKILEENGYHLLMTEHLEQFDTNNSLYPMLYYKKVNNEK